MDEIRSELLAILQTHGPAARYVTRYVNGGLFVAFAILGDTGPTVEVVSATSEAEVEKNLLTALKARPITPLDPLPEPMQDIQFEAGRLGGKTLALSTVGDPHVHYLKARIMSRDSADSPWFRHFAPSKWVDAIPGHQPVDPAMNAYVVACLDNPEPQPINIPNPPSKLVPKE